MATEPSPSPSLILTVRWWRGSDGAMFQRLDAPAVGCSEGGRWGCRSGPMRAGVGEKGETAGDGKLKEMGSAIIT